MALTGEEIPARLSVLAAKWSVYDGGERQEAQTFLNELFECYGTARQEVASFEQRQGTTFLDYLPDSIRYGLGTSRPRFGQTFAPPQVRRLAPFRGRPATATPSPTSPDA